MICIFPIDLYDLTWILGWLQPHYGWFCERASYMFLLFVSSWQHTRKSFNLKPQKPPKQIFLENEAFALTTVHFPQCCKCRVWIFLVKELKAWTYKMFMMTFTQPEWHDSRMRASCLLAKSHLQAITDNNTVLRAWPHYL